jgi:hypothetical protein
MRLELPCFLPVTRLQEIIRNFQKASKDFSAALRASFGLL